MRQTHRYLHQIACNSLPDLRRFVVNFTSLVIIYLSKRVHKQKNKIKRKEKGILKSNNQRICGKFHSCHSFIHSGGTIEQFI